MSTRVEYQVWWHGFIQGAYLDYRDAVQRAHSLSLRGFNGNVIKVVEMPERTKRR